MILAIYLAIKLAIILAIYLQAVSACKMNRTGRTPLNER